MKLIDKLASDYVLNHIDPSMQVTMAPDDLCAMVYRAGFRDAIQLAAKRLVGCTEKYWASDASAMLLRIPDREWNDA